MDARARQTRDGFRFLYLALLISILVGLIGYYIPLGHDPIVGALIWTGRLAFLIFLIPLFASPLRTLYRTRFTMTLLRWRRNAGICYGAAQSVHLVIVLLMFATLAEPPTETLMVIIGGMGLALSIAMLVTSFPIPTRAVGPKVWKWIHKAGFHVFMFIYVYDFVVEPLILDRPASHMLWASLTLAGMAVRTVVLFKREPTAQQAT